MCSPGVVYDVYTNSSAYPIPGPPVYVPVGLTFGTRDVMTDAVNIAGLVETEASLKLSSRADVARVAYEKGILWVVASVFSIDSN